MQLREFALPDVGEGLTEAEVLGWRVAVGDTVTVNQTIVEIETAKAAVELPCPFEGTVRELLVAEGATVAVGSPLISIETAGADSEPAPAGTDVLVGYGAQPAHTTRRPRRRVVASFRQPAEASLPARVPATPPVRKLAKERGIDLARVGFSGDRVTRADLEAHLTPDDEPADQGRADEIREPIRGVRRATARAMVRSAFTAPHVTEFLTVDVTRTMKIVRELAERPELTGTRVTPLLLVARALLSAVRHHPEINATWDEDADEIVRKLRVNLGIAVASPRGLVVPNIKDAHLLTLPQLAEALTALVNEARAGSTPPASMRGGTLTITNIGVFGVDTATPILNPGEAAILCVGAVRRLPWEHKGRVALRQVAQLSLSFDHRLIDGELGSRVLRRVGAVLENPKSELLLE